MKREIQYGGFVKWPTKPEAEVVAKEVSKLSTKIFKGGIMGHVKQFDVIVKPNATHDPLTPDWTIGVKIVAQVRSEEGGR